MPLRLGHNNVLDAIVGSEHLTNVTATRQETVLMTRLFFTTVCGLSTSASSTDGAATALRGNGERGYCDDEADGTAHTRR